MNRKIFIVFITVLVLTAITGGIFAYLNLKTSFFHGTVTNFGPLKLGGDMPLGPGSYTLAPPMHIPPARFHIEVAQKDLGCVFEYCIPEGEKIAALGGWLQGENTQQPEIKEIFGLSENKDVTTVVVVGDKDARIVGIYPNKNIDDVPSILEIHHDLWR